MGHLAMSDVDVPGDSRKINNFFNIPGLFVGLSPKDISDSDSVRSPKSPLDFRAFSNLCNSPRSPHDRRQMSWDNSKVGLSIVDSLVDDFRVTGTILRESKNILFGSRTLNCRNHIDSFQAPKSLPKSFAISPPTHTKSRLRRGNPDVVFEISDSPLESDPRTRKVVSCSVDSGMSFAALSSANEIELSEDYTCVTSHGSSPKTTRIYNDCILESLDTKSVSEFVNKEEILAPYLSCDFLSYCCSCKAKLEEGKDIYIYRGEKSFCSLECRWKEILMDEQLEKNIEESSKKFPEYDEEEQLFELVFP